VGAAIDRHGNWKIALAVAIAEGAPGAQEVAA